MSLSVGTIEKAIFDRLKPAKDSNALLGYRIMTLDLYTGQLESDEVAASFPAVFVTYGGDWKQAERHQGGWKLFPEFVVMVGAINMRNTAQARQQAAPGEVGASQIARDIRQLLADEDFGLDIDKVALGRTDVVLTTALKERGAVVLGLTFRTGLIEPKRQSGGEDAEFLTVQAQWDVPPHAPPPTEPLPVPAADATDNYTVRDV